MGSPGRPKGPERRGFPLRARPHVLEAVERVAAAELRSANSLIEEILEKDMRRRGALSSKKASDSGGT